MAAARRQRPPPSTPAPDRATIRATVHGDLPSGTRCWSCWDTVGCPDHRIRPGPTAGGGLPGRHRPPGDLPAADTRALANSASRRRRSATTPRSSVTPQEAKPAGILSNSALALACYPPNTPISMSLRTVPTGGHGTDPTGACHFLTCGPREPVCHRCRRLRRWTTRPRRRSCDRPGSFRQHRKSGRDGVASRSTEDSRRGRPARTATAGRERT